MTASLDPLAQFLAAADAHPNRPAIVEDEGNLTYAQLLDRVGRLAHAIVDAGVANPRVVIHLPQCSDAYAAMFATLMAGGFYCPLNLTHPPARRAKIIDLFEPHVVITSTRFPLHELGISERAKVIETDALAGRALASPAAPSHLAYVMFTSGSTGEPKGVMVGRAGLGHYMQWAQRAMELTAEDRWSQHPNIGFDLSVLDIYGALGSGAALVPLTSKKSRLMPAMVIRDQRLTIWDSVPTVMDLMKRTGHLTAEMLAPLRMMTFCGEPLLKEHLEGVFAARPDLVVHNTYGPTEATVSCTLVRLSRDNYQQRCRQSMTLGAAIEGMKVDLEGGTGADGEEGEIVISGPQVAFGYWQAPELTRAAFELSDGDPPARRSYRTGDWGQRYAGELYFLSRTDRQVKRRGFRIELGDIDAAARALTDRAVCTVFVNGKLYTFLDGANDGTADGLSERLAEKIPPYMLPDEIRYIAKFPRNANDKIDVSELQRIVEREP